MDTKKGLDLAAGRLTRTPGPRGNPRSGRPKRISSYGAERLGISAEAGPAPANASQPPSPLSEKPPDPTAASLEPARWRPRLGDLRALGKYGRRPWVLTAALGAVAAVALAWLLWGGAEDDATPPRAIAQTRRPSPAAAVIASRPTTREARTAGDDSRAESQPAPSSRAASRPTQPKSGTDPLTAGVSSFLGWFRAAGVRAAREDRALARLVGERPSGVSGSGRGPAAPTTSQPAEVAAGPGETAALPDGDGPSAGPGGDGSGVQGQAPGAPPALLYQPCPPGFSFTGAIHQPTGVFANINGRFVRVGDTVQGAKVVKIGRSSVEMELKGRRFVVGFGTGPPRRVERDEADGDKQSPDEPPAGEKDANAPGEKSD